MTKNNTCLKCGKHIDKGDAGDNWLTIIKTKYYADADNEKGYKTIKGYRVTLCSLCMSKIDDIIFDLRMLQIEKEVKE